MAHGRKRIWAGAVLLGLAAMSGVLVVASRWYGFQFVTDDRTNRTRISVTAGSLDWVRAPSPGIFKAMVEEPIGVSMSKLTRPGFDFLVQDSSPISRLSGLKGFEWRGVCWYYADVNSTLAFLSVVVWPIPLACGAAGVVSLWSGLRRRRVAQGHCSRCGYDLSATPVSAPCPECGEVRVIKLG